MLQAVNTRFDSIEGMRIAEMAGHRHAVINEVNHRSGGVWGHSEIELDRVHPGSEQSADLLRHSFWRGDVIEHLGEGGIVKAFVRAVEQRAADEQPWSKLFATGQVGFDLLHLL